MSGDKDQNDEKNGGFHLNKDGINCLFCRCKRSTFHKETTINKEGKTIVENRSSWRIGKRGVTPSDDIFKNTTDNEQSGSVEICDTGWGQSQVTPEELEERVEKLESDVDEIKKDIKNIEKNNLEVMD